MERLAALLRRYSVLQQPAVWVLGPVNALPKRWLFSSPLRPRYACEPIAGILNGEPPIDRSGRWKTPVVAGQAQGRNRPLQPRAPPVTARSHRLLSRRIWTLDSYRGGNRFQYHPAIRAHTDLHRIVVKDRPAAPQPTCCAAAGQAICKIKGRQSMARQTTAFHSRAAVLTRPGQRALFGSVEGVPRKTEGTIHAVWPPQTGHHRRLLLAAQ